MPKEVFPTLLILVGAALALGAVFAAADNLTASEPASVGQWVLDILQFIFGAGLSGVMTWLTYLKKDKPPAPARRNVAMDDGQLATENGRIINQGQGSQYFEKVDEVHIHPEEKPRPNPRFGSIPARKSADDYVLRGMESAVLDALKRQRAAVIVSGMGGVGKSEMAAHIANEKTLWVDASAKPAEDILAELARQADVMDRQADYQPSDLLAALHGALTAETLVVLDDVREKALGRLLDSILALPCRFLLTTRLAAVGALKVFNLGEMTPEQALDLMARILGPEAVQHEAQTARRVAERVFYNPLGVEIAARWVLQRQGLAHPFAAYYAIIEKNLGAARAAGDVRWNLFGAFDVTVHDLTETERGRFFALAVFAPSGFSPQAAAAVWACDLPAARETLDHLLNLRLIMPAAGPGERYRLHDLLREYAQGKLPAEAQREAESRLADWLAGFYAEIDQPNETNLPKGLAEKDNLLAACAAMTARQDARRLAQLTTQPHNWFRVHFGAHTTDWLGWLQTALALGLPEQLLKANVLKAIGDVQQFRDERDAALESYHKALGLFREIGDKLGEANCIQALGDVHRGLSELPAARTRYEEALPIYRAIGDKLGEANCIQALGDVHTGLSELPAARTRYEEALPIYRAIGAKLGEANVLQSHGKLLIFTGQSQEGLRLLQDALNIYEAIGSIPGRANIYFFLGQLLASNQQKEKAIELMVHAVELGKQIDPDHPVTLYMMDVLAQVRNM